MSGNLSGQQLGPYQVGDPIGEGGIGQVYQAVHVRTGRSYALKVLTDSDDSALPRFRREAEALSAIGHPGVVAIHDFDESSEGIAYLVMDRLEGADLARRIARGAMPLEEALDRFDEVADALRAAHAAGVLHRDLKPSNIFLRREGDLPERAVLLDFGLAKSVDPERTKLTATGQTMGTPLYMSPEQALGEELDVRSDVYSLSAVLYEMLCGEPPFDGPNLTAILSKVLMVPPQPLRMRGVQIPDELEALILRALAKGRDGRPSTVSEFRALVRAARGVSPAPMTSRALSEPVLPPTRATPRFVPERKPRRGLLIGAALTIVATCAAIAVGIVVWGSSETIVVPQEVSSPVSVAEPLLMETEVADEIIPLPSPGENEEAPTDTQSEAQQSASESTMTSMERRSTMRVRPVAPPATTPTTPTTPPATTPPTPPGVTPEALQAIMDSNRATWNATIATGEERIANYEREIRWLDQAERRGVDARTICNAPDRIPGLTDDFQPRAVRMARPRICEKLQEVDDNAARRGQSVTRFRDGFDRARRRIAERDDDTLSPADRAELLRRIDRVEQVATREPFRCFDPSFASLSEYARNLGARAAQPALELSRAIDRICRLEGHLRSQEQRFGAHYDRDRATARSNIESQRDMIRNVRQLIQRYAP